MARARWIDKDKGWKHIQREMRRLARQPHVQVGIFGAKAAQDHGGLSNVEVATTHEFGAEINHPGGTAYIVGKDGQARFVSNEAAKGRNLPRTQPHLITIPERSFIRATVDANSARIATMAKKLQRRVLSGSSTTKKALEMLGLYVQGLMRKRISSGIPPPLKPETIKRKGSATPLIDKGQLRASIDYRTRNV